MLASAVVTPIAGRLGDLLGHRPVLLACLGCLAAGGALAAASDHAGWFGGVPAGRTLQGVSGGVFPLTFGLARRWTPPERLHGVIAALGAMFGVGGALAMAVAGPLAGALGTAALSLLSVLITFLALAGVLIRLSRGDTPARTGRHGTVLDLPGTLLLAAALVALLLGVTQGRTRGWGSAATLATLISALVLGAGFAAVESRSSEPVVDPRLLRGRGPALTHLATFVISVAMFAAVTLIPQYAQTPAHAGYGFGTSATGTGLLLAPMAVAMVAAAPLSTRLAARAGSGTAFRAGAALAATTLAALGVAHGALWQFALAGTALGVAYGFAFASLGGLVVNAVRPDRTGAATGVNTLLRTLGGAVGAQLAAVIITGSAAATPTETGYTVAFLASADGRRGGPRTLGRATEDADTGWPASGSIAIEAVRCPANPANPAGQRTDVTWAPATLVPPRSSPGAVPPPRRSCTAPRGRCRTTAPPTCRSPVARSGSCRRRPDGDGARSPRPPR